jgi:dTDP-4-dehydrorhamnose 3,5-epimerase
LKVEKLNIADVLLITPPRFGDERGYFSEIFNAPRLAEHGLTDVFIQDNQSFSKAKGVLRGLHCQVAPFVQGKLVRVIRGSIWDVAVDARHGSRTFGRHVAAELSAANWQQLWIPPGFVHGFVTLEPDSEVVYKTTGYYDKESERAIIWNDPDLALPWPVTEVQLSDKDKVATRWADMPAWFRL